MPSDTGNCPLDHFWSCRCERLTPYYIAVVLFFRMWQGRPEVFTPAVPQAGPV